METFELKQEHLTLLQRAYIGWEHCEYGAPAIDCKRPYGNSSVEHDIAEILEWELEEDEDGYNELSEEQSDLAYELHQGTQTALQIILATESFKTGTYRLTEKYDTRSWELVEES